MQQKSKDSVQAVRRWQVRLSGDSVDHSVRLIEYRSTTESISKDNIYCLPHGAEFRHNVSCKQGFARCVDSTRYCLSGKIRLIRC